MDNVLLISAHIEWLQGLYKAQYHRQHCTPQAFEQGMCKTSMTRRLGFELVPRDNGPNKYCTALHCTALHCTALHCTALHCTALHCTALHCSALHCTALHCTALHCYAIHCTALHYTALHCTAVYCTVLHYIALHCTALYCTALQEIYWIDIILTEFISSVNWSSLFSADEFFLLY